MAHRTGIALVVTFLLGLATATFLNRPIAAQPPAVPVPANALYWASTVPGPPAPYLVLVNVQTGECWTKFITTGDGTWQHLGTPAGKPQK